MGAIFCENHPATGKNLYARCREKKNLILPAKPTYVSHTRVIWLIFPQVAQFLQFSFGKAHDRVPDTQVKNISLGRIEIAYWKCASSPGVSCFRIWSHFDSWTRYVSRGASDIDGNPLDFRARRSRVKSVWFHDVHMCISLGWQKRSDFPEELPEKYEITDL